ncbi:hypothetical protein B0J17DRAFT_681167 [Rhizoctonia solani]|nr:hypothetical protein B0J17DRAFT_681167 [Rhizoctonia solani]
MAMLKISVELVAKFGVGLVLGLLAKIDTCLLTLLSILNVCSNGALSPIADISSDFAQLYFKLSASALESAGL